MANKTMARFQTLHKHQPMIVVDPGLNGGVAIQHSDGSIDCFNAPSTEAVHSFLAPYKGTNYWFVIEQQAARRGNGISSSWTFAMNYSSWLTAARCYGLPVITITPQSWMSKLDMPKKLSKTDRKNFIKAFAQEKFPHFKVTLKTSDALAFILTFIRYYLIHK